ncbi:MAG: pyridoxal-phosphate dependent enzyme [Woeseia sp.]|nr:pyridoxal-phosphate dependent enzyme [Woeseia sp.]
MSNFSDLRSAYPALREALPTVRLTDLPTPVRSVSLAHASGTRTVLIKEDNLSAGLYGGNKVRKLEYLLARAILRKRKTIATFGAVGSHHALATTLYARQLNLHTIAFLSHQSRTRDIAATLSTHLAAETELVSYGGSYAERIATLRQHLRGRRAMIIPAGGSSWLGNVAFMDAAFEFAAQVSRGECPLPDRVYIATGTMGTAVGLALGFALCKLPTEVHAIRITPSSITDETLLRRLATKTAYMLHRLDNNIPDTLARNIKLTLRHEFFGSGYAHSNADTERAIALAERDLGMTLEATYTGKAMAALLHDIGVASNRGMTPLFWQSYHAAALPVVASERVSKDALPRDFLRYFC